MRIKKLSLLAAIVLNGCTANPVVSSGAVAETESDGTTLQLSPGTIVLAEASVGPDGKLTLAPVDHVGDAAKTLRFEFTVDESNSFLMVSNPLSNAIKYRLDMVDGHGRLFPTSSCPVQANLKAFEHWPHPIFALRLSEAHVLAEGHTVSCEY